MSRRPHPDPPRPRGNAVRIALSFAREPLLYPERCARELGDVVFMPVPMLPLYVVSHPELISEVLVKQHRLFIKDRLTRQLEEGIGHGLLVSEGDLWKKQRRLAQPAFHHARVTGYARVMAELAEHAAREVEPGVHDVHALMMRVTLSIVGRTLFGAEVGDRAETVSRALDVIMDRYRGILGSGLVLPARLPTPANRRFVRARHELSSTLLQIITERRRRGGESDDLLGMLLDARDDEDGTAMTDSQLRDECITLFVAGHETTALALGYALWSIAHHPEEQRELRAEVDRVFAGRSPALDDIPRLERTAGVVKEAMRLYPPAWAIGREALEDVELGGYRIPRGSQIGIFQWIVHRDPRWFAEPEAFRPSRWLDGLEARLPRFAYLPFGGGPRVCIGNAFAMLEATLVLAILVARLRFEPAGTKKLELVPTITLRPRGGIPLGVERR